MAKDYKILGASDCSRCGAKAKLIAKEQNPKSDTLAICIECPKCKYKLISGFTSRKEIKRVERHSELLKKYKEVKTPLERGKIMKEIQKMASEEEDWLTAVGNS